MAYNRTFPSMEDNCYCFNFIVFFFNVLCHKEPARSKKNTPKWGYFYSSKAPSWGLWMQRVGSLRHKIADVATPRNSSRHRVDNFDRRRYGQVEKECRCSSSTGRTYNWMGWYGLV